MVQPLLFRLKAKALYHSLPGSLVETGAVQIFGQFKHFVKLSYLNSRQVKEINLIFQIVSKHACKARIQVLLNEKKKKKHVWINTFKTEGLPS